MSFLFLKAREKTSVRSFFFWFVCSFVWAPNQHVITKKAFFLKYEVFLFFDLLVLWHTHTKRKRLVKREKNKFVRKWRLNFEVVKFFRNFLQTEDGIPKCFFLEKHTCVGQTSTTKQHSYKEASQLITFLETFTKKKLVESGETLNVLAFCRY